MTKITGQKTILNMSRPDVAEDDDYYMDSGMTTKRFVLSFAVMMGVGVPLVMKLRWEKVA